MDEEKKVSEILPRLRFWRRCPKSIPKVRRLR